MHGTLDRQYPITTIQPYRRPCLGRLSQVLLIIYWLMPTLIRNTVWWRKQGIPVWPYMHLTLPRSRAMIPPSIFLVSRFVQATFTQNIMIVDAGTSPSFQVLSIGVFWHSGNILFLKKSPFHIHCGKMIIIQCANQTFGTKKALLLSCVRPTLACICEESKRLPV